MKRDEYVQLVCRRSFVDDQTFRVTTNLWLSSDWGRSLCTTVTVTITSIPQGDSPLPFVWRWSYVQYPLNTPDRGICHYYLVSPVVIWKQSQRCPRVIYSICIEWMCMYVIVFTFLGRVFKLNKSLLVKKYIYIFSLFRIREKRGKYFFLFHEQKNWLFEETVQTLLFSSSYWKFTFENRVLDFCPWPWDSLTGFFIFFKRTSNTLILSCRFDVELCLSRKKTRVNVSSRQCVYFSGICLEVENIVDDSDIFHGQCCLLWIDKTRAKDKTYIWVSVWWKTKN